MCCSIHELHSLPIFIAAIKIYPDLLHGNFSKTYFCTPQKLFLQSFREMTLLLLKISNESFEKVYYRSYGEYIFKMKHKT